MAIAGLPVAEDGEAIFCVANMAKTRTMTMTRTTTKKMTMTKTMTFHFFLRRGTPVDGEKKEKLPPFWDLDGKKDDRTGGKVVYSRT